MNLKEWIRSLPPEEQAVFFRKAARFFSNRELSDIMKSIRNGSGVYAAHIKAGVLDRYEVDLNNLKC